MSSAYIGEIRVFGFNFNPRGWQFCRGQLLAISSNTALFSILGTTYGGNGTTNFQLPNFQSRVPVAQGTGPGLSNWVLGQQDGVENVTLLLAQMAQHNHTFNVTSANGTQQSSNNAQLARGFKGNFTNATSAKVYSTVAPAQAMDSRGLGSTVGNQPHNNIMPYLALNFCIATQGIFPPRN
jgi:microcystin-dependent protein